MRDHEWSRREMLATAAASLLRDDDVAVVGLGLPQVAALLAKRTHAPNAALLLEIGAFEPAPQESTMGIADPRLWEGSTAFGGMVDVLGTMLHGGRVSVGLLGALQVDASGSINSTQVVGDDGHVRRFNGSGGANDIASLAGRVLVVMQHHPRKFAQTVEFLTSPGRRVHGRSRREVGLPGRGTVAIVTDRAVIDVTDSDPVLTSVHPGETSDEVLAATPLRLTTPRGGVGVTPAPTVRQLALIREELDPAGWYTR
jgi:glutaconate CoA-transferase, subunit B